MCKLKSTFIIIYHSAAAIVIDLEDILHFEMELSKMEASKEKHIRAEMYSD